MKDFDFKKNDYEEKTASAYTSISFNTYLDSTIRWIPATVKSKTEAIELLNKETIPIILRQIENVEVMKLICELFQEKDEAIKKLAKSRPIVYKLIKMAKSQFLTEILMRDIKIENKN
jgi:hypothetical protein